MIGAFLVAILVGIGIGLISGMLGIGGGVVMIPLFRLAFGMSAIASTATSLFTIIPTSVSGAITHVRGKTCLPKVGIALGVGGACLSPVGVWLAQLSPGWLVMLAAALAIGYSATTMLRKVLKTPKARLSTQSKEDAPITKAASEGDSGATEDVRESLTFGKYDLRKAVCIGAIAGIASGYVGLGGGFLMVPLILSVLHVPMRLASGTSLIGVMILALPATVIQCMLGNVDYLIGIGVACGSIPGAIIGAKLVSRVPERSLRLMFAALLGVAAVLLVMKELGAMGVVALSW